MKSIYLDYAASTPIDPRVVAAMSPYFTEIFANPNSLHRFGQEASRAVFVSRQTIARSLGADYKEIIFTGSATEANNLALRGSIKAIQKIQIHSNNSNGNSDILNRPRIIVSVIEHESVLETCRDLEKEGVEVIYISVNKEGIVDLKKLKSTLNDRTVLVSVMYANNEIGTIQPIDKISEIIRNFRESRIKNQESRKADSKFIIHNSLFPLFHTDAVQAFQYLDCNVKNLGVDLMTLSAHKIYGPKGIGALYVRDAIQKIQIHSNNSNGNSDISDRLLAPIITGGDQENGLRSGTENVSYIVGFAKAVEIADKVRGPESARVEKLRNYFWRSLQKAFGSKSIALNGSLQNRLPNNLNIYFAGRSAQELLIKLDLVGGVAASSGAACATRVNKESHVLKALGFTPARASGSLRFSLGRPTTKKEIDSAVEKLKNR
ncbi:MAG: Cysteine desulfurase [Parcubacteria group bacterium GW2011_GWA2_47_8b]|nr:MAG: Cysteine desulfurase [Parcubacteria group bacterium GW2011_GWA2_47_8b]